MILNFSLKYDVICHKSINNPHLDENIAIVVVSEGVSTCIFKKAVWEAG